MESYIRRAIWKAAYNEQFEKYACIGPTRRSKYRRVLGNVAQKKFYAHTDFEKIDGTLVIYYKR